MSAWGVHDHRGDVPLLDADGLHPAPASRLDTTTALRPLMGVHVHHGVLKLSLARVLPTHICRIWCPSRWRAAGETRRVFRGVCRAWGLGWTSGYGGLCVGSSVALSASSSSSWADRTARGRVFGIDVDYDRGLSRVISSRTGIDLENGLLKSAFLSRTSGNRYQISSS